MTGTAVYRAMGVVSVCFFLGACGEPDGADIPKLCPECPSTAAVGKVECHWEAAASSDSGKKDLVCTVGSTRVTVDTAGIGEG